MTEYSFGVALGGGGARGVAHLVILEAFDELGIKPSLIAGTSIGSIVGAGYAAGYTAKELSERVCEFYANRREIYSRLWRVRPRAIGDLVRRQRGSTQFDPVETLRHFVPGVEAFDCDFSDLKIPLRVVACDYYGWQETVIDSGSVLHAVAASIAIPSIFKPVLIDGRVQIDGGAFNPLPFDHVRDTDIVVASDVAGGPSGKARQVPGVFEVVIGAAQISMHAITSEKLKWCQPEILVRPEVSGFFVLDFLRCKDILEANSALKDDVKRRIEAAIEERRLRDEAHAAQEAAENASLRRRLSPAALGKELFQKRRSPALPNA